MQNVIMDFLSVIYDLFYDYNSNIIILNRPSYKLKGKWTKLKSKEHYPLTLNIFLDYIEVSVK